jgi:hypothetical protein
MKPRPVSADSPSMTANRFDLPGLILVCLIVVYCAGCSSISTGRSRETQETLDSIALAEARAALLTLNQQNAGLENFKGTGKIKVWQQGRLKLDERIAWIGSNPSKISIVVLISGYPAVKMASDGKWFYYYEVGEGDPIYKKIAASDASLKRIMSIPIHTSDILSLLSGRVPLREHQSAFFLKQDSEPGYVLVLKRRWWGVTEKIYFAENKTQVRHVEFYDRTGSLIYDAKFDEMQMISGYQVPARLSITNGKDTDFQLDINRFWADVQVTADMFVLNPPD